MSSLFNYLLFYALDFFIKIFNLFLSLFFRHLKPNEDTVKQQWKKEQHPEILKKTCFCKLYKLYMLGLQASTDFQSTNKLFFSKLLATLTCKKHFQILILKNREVYICSLNKMFCNCGLAVVHGCFGFVVAGLINPGSKYIFARI